MPVTRGWKREKCDIVQVSIGDNPSADFDWYRATVHGVEPAAVIHEIELKYPLATVRQAGGRHGYDRGAEVMAGEHKHASIWWSSTGQNSGVCVDAPSGASRAVRDALQCFEHRVTRADIRLDYIEDGLFDYMSAVLIEFARHRGLKIDQMGDWVRGRARTLYVGSRSSTAFLRLYEKGQKEHGNPHWIRLELECKPKGSRGYACAKYEPADYLGASRWVRDALERLGIEYDKPGQSLGDFSKTDSIARGRLAMLRQYGKMLGVWIAEHDDAESAIGEITYAMSLSNKHRETGDFETFIDLMRLLEGGTALPPIDRALKGEQRSSITGLFKENKERS